MQNCNKMRHRLRMESKEKMIHKNVYTFRCQLKMNGTVKFHEQVTILCHYWWDFLTDNQVQDVYTNGKGAIFIYFPFPWQTFGSPSYCSWGAPIIPEQHSGDHLGLHLEIGRWECFVPLVEQPSVHGDLQQDQSFNGKYGPFSSWNPRFFTGWTSNLILIL